MALDPAVSQASTPTVDYNALAAQVRQKKPPTPKAPASIDYNAIAAKVREAKPAALQTMMPGSWKGLKSPGNLNIWDRPMVQNADGTHSSEYSVSFADQSGTEVLVPTVVKGKFLTPDGKKPKQGSPEEKTMFKAAWQHYLQTGENLGKFANPQDADAYAQVLHNRGTRPSAESPHVTEEHGSIRPYEPTWWQKVKNVFGQSGAAGALSSAEYVKKYGTGDVTAEVSQFLKHPLAGFQELFPANPKTALGRVGKGFATAASGMTSPAQLALIAAPGLGEATKIEAIPQAFHAVGMAMMPTMAVGVYQSGKNIYDSRKSGNKEAEEEAYGDLAFNLGFLIGPHVAGEFAKGSGAVKLNTAADKIYGKDFRKLGDEEKANVLYSSLEDASPRFKQRVDAEAKKLEKQRGYSALERGKELGELELQRREIRTEAAKTVVAQAFERQGREEAFRRHAQVREHEARQQQEASRVQGERDREQAAAEAGKKSIEEQRGFPVEESRTAENLPVTGVRKTTEREPGQRYEPEPTEPTIPVMEKRSIPAPVPEAPSAKVTAAEARVQTLSEERMGQSFSSLPLARQTVASRWMERFHPEAWKEFQDTPAYRVFQGRTEGSRLADTAMRTYLARHPTGEAEALDPNADLQAGLARLVLARTDVSAAFKEHPETQRDLNEHAEKSMGKSYDSLDAEGRTAALAEYLRDKPEAIRDFLTPDLADRIRSGQHVDLANMEAQLIDRHQVRMLMEFRDEIQQNMDAQAAQQLVTEERGKQEKKLSDTMYEALTSRDPSLAPVFDASRGITHDAQELGLGPVNGYDDLFRIERAVKATADNLRTPQMRAYLTQMARIRQVAESHILKGVAEATADSFRAEGLPEARAKAAKQIIQLDDTADNLQKLADNQRLEGKKAEAADTEIAAAGARKSADAVMAGAQSVTNPAPEPAEARELPLTVGNSTRVVSPNNKEGMPAHYAVIDANEAQTSHLPVTFEYRPGYNQNGQPRDYRINKNAQAAVEARAANLDPEILLSNDPQTMGGPPILDQRGHVISGNGRMLSLLTAISRKPEEFTRYQEELARRANAFGINPDELEKYRNPVLVKVLDRPVEAEEEWPALGIEFNRDPTQGLSESEQGVAMARLLNPEYLERLNGIIDTMPFIESDGKPLSVREAMRSRSKEIAQLMMDAGIIAPNKTEEFLTSDGQLKERAKDLFEHMLGGITVSNPAVIERSSLSTKDKLTRAGLFFLRMRNAGENWNLQSMNTDAVRLMTRAQDAAARLSMLMGKAEMEEKRGKGNVPAEVSGSESLVEKYLHPERYHYSERSLAFDDQPLHEPVHAGVEALARALEESPKEYAALMAKYADRANGVQHTFFGAEHPADVFTNEIASRYGLKVIPEEWGAVVGLSDTVKDEIEAARGELPVETPVHAQTVIADVTPDSSSVTEAIPEGPRNVRDLQKALEVNPNVGPEQAEALRQVFEEIMPRAIGQDLNELLGNRRLGFALGGREADYRGYHEIVDDGRAIIRLCDTADTSTFLHEMAHYLRRYLRPADQEVANRFVGAKPAEEWTRPQEERFAEAFERYHHDGGIRRGKLEKAFSTLSRAMQSIYNAVTMRKMAKGTPELNAMFDNWYDWTRAERKPITARIDVDKLEEDAARGVEIPASAKVVRSNGVTPSAHAKNFLFLDDDGANQFVDSKKKQLRAWQILRTGHEEGAPVYVRAEAKGNCKLFQPSLNEMIDLAKKAKDLEGRLKKEVDPREQARLRGALNGIEDKLRSATGIVGGAAEPKDTSVIQLVHGVSEMPTVSEPTTPAQAATVHQVYGDPTGIELGGEHGPKGAVSHRPAGVRGAEGDGEVHGGAGQAHGEHGGESPEGSAKRAIASPGKDPLAKVKAARLAAPKVARGAPVVDPEAWRGHVDALGLPKGTPVPTVRLEPDARDILKFPGQPETVEGALSALQQYDGTIVASSPGTGKTYMLSAIAHHLLGTGGDRVGLLVTRSQNLIHEADGFQETARRFGIDVDDLPSEAKGVSTGMYAATYSGIRGNRDVLSIPWDFVLFDESGEAANWTESAQGKAAVLLGHAAKKVVYSSATPYSTVMEMGYMHKLGLWPPGGFAEWASQFGLVESGPNTFTGGNAPRKLEKLRQQLIERGQWQQLFKDLDGTEAHVVLVPQTPEVREGIRKIRAAFSIARNAFQRAGMSKYLTPTAGHEAIYLKRFISGARLADAIDKVGKPAIAAGWAPVFFTEYRSPAEEGMDFFHNLPGDMGKTINAMLPPLPDVVATMRGAFGKKIGIFAGEANQLRAEELEGFHSGEKDAIYMTFAAGGVGANAQDKIGDKPRMGIFIDLPWGGKMLEQGTNRTYRFGSQSGAVNVFMTSDALPEMKLLGTKVLPRMRALKAAVFGAREETKLSRNLRDATGLPEELLQYEQGQEYEPQAADFEVDPKTIEGGVMEFTPIDNFEMPDAGKFRDKPIKYKGEGKKLYQRPAERRRNLTMRKKVEEMSPEEMRKALLTSDKTELPNSRAFDEAERDNPAPAVAMSDADGLKAFNDTFGYKSGDLLLKAKAEALKQVELDAYHEKGDEFLYRGKSKEELIGKLEKAREILRNRVFDVTMDDGRMVHLKGVDFSYGAGDDLYEAEERQHAHKNAREAAGERKRGELGRIVEVQREGEDDSRAEAVEARRLYQGPKDDADRLMNDAWNQLLERSKKLPASTAAVVTANEGLIRTEAVHAGRKAKLAGEDVKEAIDRKTRDMENDALIWLDDLKGRTKSAAHFVKSSIWMFGTSGDRAVMKAAKAAGSPEIGIELKRRIIDYDIRSGNYRGEFGGMVERIISDNDLRPKDLELVSKVVEGQETSDNAHINKAVREFRQFTAGVRKRMADAGLSVGVTDDKGNHTEVPYTKIADDPNYWPRIYDWNKKFVVPGENGARIVTSLAKIMDMPTSDERRDELIEKVAQAKGISKAKAQLFFDRNARGIRLAGNVERAREFDIPMYGRDRQALERYVNQVAEKIAAAEVHGQHREKTDALIEQIRRPDTRQFVNRIITSDLNPAHLHDADRIALRLANQWLVLSKMSLSAMKLPFHIAKTSMATDTRSVMMAFLRASRDHKEFSQNAIDCGALTNYVRQAYMREYGLKTGGIDQKMLDFNGFTILVNASRVMASAAGRLWFEKYAYPELRDNPKNPVLRRKLADLYGMSDEQMDNIAANGYGPEDVRRMELGAANWTTGSWRPSELPPAVRGTMAGDDWLSQRFVTLMRIAQSLHGFMFKTANLVNRTVWHELYQSDFKSLAPYRLVARFAGNFGLAGLALHELLHLRHQMSGSTEKQVEDRRRAWLAEHPMSKEALFSAMSDITMGMGVDVLTQLFDELSTHDPKDKQKIVQQERVIEAGRNLVLGVAPQDLYTAVKAAKDYQATFEDTGRHELSPEKRREEVLQRLAVQEVPLSREIIHPKKAPRHPFPRRHSRALTALQ